MTTDREAEIAALIAEHPAALGRNQTDDHLWECRCGQIMGLSDSPLEARHRRHLALVLAAYITDREGDAWERVTGLIRSIDALANIVERDDTEFGFTVKGMGPVLRALADPFRSTPEE